MIRRLWRWITANTRAQAVSEHPQPDSRLQVTPDTLEEPMGPIDHMDIHTAEQARYVAIAWQHEFGDRSYFQSELNEWTTYFEALAERFPELADEFRENGII